MNIKGQGHPASTFSNLFSLETTQPIEAKFYVEPWDVMMKMVQLTWPMSPRDEEMKVSINGL